MKRRLLVLGLLVLMLSLGALGCTEPNPTYAGEDGAQGQDKAVRDMRVVDGPHVKPERGSDLPKGTEAGVKADGLVVKDGLVKDVKPKADLPLTDGKKPDGPKADLPKADLKQPDLKKPDLTKPDLAKPDLAKPDLTKPDLTKPDGKPPQCTVDGDCDDKLVCTKDTCTLGVCSNTLLTGTCLINKVCYKTGDPNPQNVCSECVGQTSSSTWTNLPDGTACTSDTLACTSDTCQKGVCTYTVTTGCLISGTCVAEGAVASSDVCKECVGALSKTAYTFASGKLCTPATGGSGLCAAQKCRGFTGYNYDVQTSSSSALVSVAYVPADGSTWAVSQLFAGSSAVTSSLVDLPSLAGTVSAKPIPKRMRAIHYNLAVGDGGEAWQHNGTQWTQATSLMKVLGTGNRLALWGMTFLGNEAYLITGDQTSTQAGIVLCGGTDLINGVTVCAPHTGVATNNTIGGISATVKSNLQGAAWAITVGTNAPEDIYYNPGTGLSWTRNFPGCQDSSGGTTACSNTQNESRSVSAASDKWAWVTGTDGLMLRFNGAAWSRIQNAWTNQSSYDLDAVYAEETEGLTVFAANYYGSNQSYVRLYAYNVKLNRWTGPVTLLNGSDANDRIVAIGGKDFSDLWFVGSRRTGGGSGSKVRGWAVNMK